MKVLLALLFLLPQVSYARDKGFALSGGVSLGIYEGGLFYSHIRKNKDIAKETKVVFGTSAGSINGLLGIFEMCGFRNNTREESLFWKLWIPYGIDQLEPKGKKETSLFTRDATKPLFEEMRKLWGEGFREDCDVHFGVAVARKEPHVDKLKPGLEIIRQSEFFSVRIKGRGKGKPPLVENQKYANINSYRSYLPVGESPEKDVEILLDLIQASSSFPAAFAPYPIHFCYSRPGEAPKTCALKDTQEELFIDGGLYHNGPVGYAYEALRKTAAGDFELHYLNASQPLVTQNIAEKEKEKGESNVLGDFQKLFGNMLVQARKFELDKSLETNPDIVKRLEINRKHFPLASDPLYAFVGFLEKDFRKSDFYLGMYDAEGEPETHAQDTEYTCYRKKLTGKDDCKLDQNLEVLIGQAQYRVKNKIYEGDFDKLYKYLEDNQYEFRDLKLKRSESKYGRIYTKDRLTRLVKNFASRQPEKQQQKLRYFIRPSLNYLQYTPLKDFWYAVYASSPEVGYSRIIPEKYLESTSFRLNGALMINGFSTFLSRSEDIWAMTPLLGLEIEPVSWNTAALQWRFGVRGGYQFANRDDIGRKKCDSDFADENPAACSGATFQWTAALSIFERIRLQMVFVPFIVNSISWDERPEVLLQLGIQFGDSF